MPDSLRGKVIRVKDPRLKKGKGDNREEVVLESLDRALERLTGEQGIRAWKALFRRSDRVAIKVNAMGGPRVATHFEVARAIATGLQRCGVSPEQILIWDRSTPELRRAGFEIRSRGEGPLCFGTDLLGYEAMPRIYGKIGSCFSPILTKWATALIDVPVLKDHDLAGVSISIKNLFGAIHNPNKYHDEGCAPYLVDLLSSDPVRRTLRLVVCDALRAQCHGGPAYSSHWNWPYGGLIVGADPVAVDRIGTEILEQKRKEFGLPTLKEEGRAPLHISRAHQAGLGEGTIEAIHLLEVG